MKISFRLFLIFAVVVVFLQFGLAQNGSTALRGQVVDPSGAAVTNATVTLIPAAGTPLAATTNNQGTFEIKAAPGKYTLDVTAPGFSLYENTDVEITAGQVQKLNVTLAIEVEKQKVEVSDTAPTVQVNPENNASAVVISGKALEALPDDPDELQNRSNRTCWPVGGTERRADLH